MKVISAVNVNDALAKGVDLFNSPINYRTQESRNGTTMEALSPVTTVYKKPWQRVLFNQARDANPFFHLYESIWMLAGSQDLKKLTHFNAGMANFSDDEKTLNGSYGYRWRQQFGYDQIPRVINMLKNDPDSRRVVLQMWDGVLDLDSSSKDIPCNTNIYFKVRDNKLQMTVCNRSNDMIWGAYGANAVHMSVLQEYVAASLSVEMGPYYQVSDSFHVYQNKEWDKVKHLTSDPFNTLYNQAIYPDEHYPLCSDPGNFISDCQNFIESAVPPRYMAGNPELVETWPAIYGGYKNYFFPEVLIPMVQAYLAHKDRKYEKCYDFLAQIKAEDWQQACVQWIKKREANWRKKNAS